MELERTGCIELLPPCNEMGLPLIDAVAGVPLLRATETVMPPLNFWSVSRILPLESSCAVLIVKFVSAAPSWVLKSLPIPMGPDRTNPDGVNVIVALAAAYPGAVIVICAVPEDARFWIQNAGKPLPLIPLPAGKVPVKLATPALVPNGSVDSGDRSNLVASLLEMVITRGDVGATSTEPMASSSRFAPTEEGCRFKWPR